ncbi:MAG: hypothetical protein GVY36_18415, partial [Verrucomicrobia bacterium]|nr:hypothetical protein [Verrucomicrobiota bacterium]
MTSIKLTGFPFLLAYADRYPLEYLQMPSETTAALHEYELITVEDLIHFVGRFQADESQQALVALDALAEVSTPTGPDWFAYWQARDFEFHNMCLTCAELEAFDNATPVCAVNRENFGNAGAMLARAGYDTLGALAEGLRSGIGDVAGMGGKKRADFFKRLVALVYDIREGQLSAESLASRFPPVFDGDSEDRDTVNASNPYKFHEDVLSLGIGILHVGAKTKM